MICHYYHNHCRDLRQAWRIYNNLPKYFTFCNNSGIPGNFPNFDHLPGEAPANDQNLGVFAQYLSSYHFIMFKTLRFFEHNKVIP